MQSDSKAKVFLAHLGSHILFKKKKKKQKTSTAFLILLSVSPAFRREERGFLFVQHVPQTGSDQADILISRDGSKSFTFY